MTRTTIDSYVLCSVAGAIYAVHSADIQQLDMVDAPTPVPNAPAYVDGVVSIRGQVIPAINLRARFGFPRSAYDVRTRLVVVRSGARTVGLIVDGAREFANIPPDALKPLPDGVGGTSGQYLRGIAQTDDRLMLVIDVPQLLALEDATTIDVSSPSPAESPASP